MRMRRVSQTLAAGALGLVILVGLNLLAVKQGWRWDVTETKRHSLAPESVQVLGQLNATVTAVAFVRPDGDKRSLEQLFELFGRECKNFQYEFVDPDRSAYRAKEEQITQPGTVVVVCGEKKEKVVFPDEQQLLNAIVRAANPRRAKVVFVSGHGELDPNSIGDRACSRLRLAITDQGADVQTLVLATVKAVPADVDLAVILGPAKDFLEHELKLLDEYFKKGGRLLAAVAAEHETNLDPWLKKNLLIERKAGYVVDPVSKAVVGDPLTPIIQDYGPNPITFDFGLITVFPTCAALVPADSNQTAEGQSPVSYLGRSSEQSWLETDTAALEAGTAEFDPKVDLPGPLWLAAIYHARAADEKHADGARVVVFGDEDFASDDYVGAAGNLDLARNTVNWLIEREGLIAISKPEGANVLLTLTATQRLALNWIPLLFVPAAMLAVSIGLALRRRRGK